MDDDVFVAYIKYYVIRNPSSIPSHETRRQEIVVHFVFESLCRILYEAHLCVAWLCYFINLLLSDFLQQGRFKIDIEVCGE